MVGLRPAGRGRRRLGPRSAQLTCQPGGLAEFVPLGIPLRHPVSGCRRMDAAEENSPMLALAAQIMVAVLTAGAAFSVPVVGAATSPRVEVIHALTVAPGLPFEGPGHRRCARFPAATTAPGRDRYCGEWGSAFPVRAGNPRPAPRALLRRGAFGASLVVQSGVGRGSVGRGDGPWSSTTTATISTGGWIRIGRTGALADSGFGSTPPPRLWS